MNDNDKARRLIEAAHKLEADYEAEGKSEIAKQVREGFGSLPVGSLARLWDILNAPPRPVEDWENIGSTTTD